MSKEIEEPGSQAGAISSAMEELPNDKAHEIVAHLKAKGVDVEIIDVYQFAKVSMDWRSYDDWKQGQGQDE